jgi:hypothetical protein
MARPANFPPDVDPADYEAGFVWSEYDQKDIWYEGVPQEKPVCSVCKKKGTDNWWHLSWGTPEKPKACHAFRSLLGNACHPCMKEHAASQRAIVERATVV